MRWGIITLTKGGLSLAKDLKNKFEGAGNGAPSGYGDAVIHAPSKLGYKEGAVIEGSFGEYVRAIFNKFDILIFIMASGIVVRTVAGCIKDKTTDPGILVMDEKGKFVISLLSGHIGGANEAAAKVAALTGAEPVITTSSDVNSLISVDILAKELNCIVDDMKSAKEITAMIVNGEKVAIISDLETYLSGNFLNNADEAGGVVCVTNKKSCRDINSQCFDGVEHPVITEQGSEAPCSRKPCVRLIPKNIIAGVGCKKNTDPKDMIEFINSRLDELGIDNRSIKRICSIDIKKNEKAILEASEYFRAELLFFPAGKIKKAESVFDFELSDFVEEQTGAGAISGPCAYLGSNGSGRMIMQKRKVKGITLSLWEERAIF